MAFICVLGPQHEPWGGECSAPPSPALARPPGWKAQRVTATARGPPAATQKLRRVSDVADLSPVLSVQQGRPGLFPGAVLLRNNVFTAVSSVNGGLPLLQRAPGLWVASPVLSLRYWVRVQSRLLTSFLLVQTREAAGDSPGTGALHSLGRPGLSSQLQPGPTRHLWAFGE